jgi:hypothetical protein
VVVGAGIVGASVAYHAARAGAVVTLVDADRPGAGVTANSFAWIGASGVRTGPAAGLRATATEEYRRLEAELPGLPVTWSGSLSWGAENGASEPGPGHEIVDAATVATLEPTLRQPPEWAPGYIRAPRSPRSAGTQRVGLSGSRRPQDPSPVRLWCSRPEWPRPRWARRETRLFWRPMSPARPDRLRGGGGSRDRGEVGDRAAPPIATTDEHVGGPLIERERVVPELAAVAYPGNDDRNVSIDAHVVHLGGHEVVTDLARCDGLEELPPGEDPVLADEHPIRLGKGSDRIGVVGHDGLVPVGDERGEDVNGARIAVARSCPKRTGRVRLGQMEPFQPPRPASGFAKSVAAYGCWRGRVAMWRLASSS